MELKSFKEINIAEPFFDSLKNDYREFGEWFNKKNDSLAYVSYDDHGNIQAKKILDHAIIENVDNIYVTVFPKHESLVRLLNKYGFEKKAEKVTPNGIEDVLVKKMRVFQNNILLDYPLINTQQNKKYILSIHPRFHTRLFPDSKLFNETYDLIEDLSHTNSIHKVYICYMEGVKALRPGDLLIVYRTSDGQGSAWYRSVATSICTVEEIKERNSFANIEEYISYCQSYEDINSRNSIE